MKYKLDLNLLILYLLARNSTLKRRAVKPTPSCKTHFAYRRYIEHSRKLRLICLLALLPIFLFIGVVLNLHEASTYVHDYLYQMSTHLFVNFICSPSFYIWWSMSALFAQPAWEASIWPSIGRGLTRSAFIWVLEVVSFVELHSSSLSVSVRYLWNLSTCLTFVQTIWITIFWDEIYIPTNQQRMSPQLEF